MPAVHKANGPSARAHQQIADDRPACGQLNKRRFVTHRSDIRNLSQLKHHIDTVVTGEVTNPTASGIFPCLRIGHVSDDLDDLPPPPPKTDRDKRR